MLLMYIIINFKRCLDMSLHAVKKCLNLYILLPQFPVLWCSPVLRTDFGGVPYICT